MTDDSALLSKAEDLVSELEMTREKYSTHALVLVEGRTDLALLDEYRHVNCRLIDSGSKDTSLQAVEIVEVEGRLEGVAAIVDLDCWIVTGSERLKIDNFLYDDTPDMETMVLESPALEKYLRHAMTGKDGHAVFEFAQHLRRKAKWLGYELGYFRTVLCFEPHQGLRLSAIENQITDFIDSQTFEIQRETIASSLTAGLGNTSAEQLLENVEQIRSKYSNGAYFRGKDTLAIVVHIFGAVYRHHFSDEDLLSKLETEIAPRPRSQAHSTVFERLRNSFEERYLMQTALYRRIRDWEARSAPFRIIKDYPLERTPA